MVNFFEKKIIIYLRKEEGWKEREREIEREVGVEIFNSKVKRFFDYWVVDIINNNKNLMIWNDWWFS